MIFKLLKKKKKPKTHIKLFFIQKNYNKINKFYHLTNILTKTQIYNEN
jgi:hypothetical protein